jgi:hypothetical protein
MAIVPPPIDPQPKTPRWAPWWKIAVPLVSILIVVWALSYDRWSTPVLVTTGNTLPAASINNPVASEQCPFISSDNSTLYFQSNRQGPGSKGKYDIYFARRSSAQKDSWQSPQILSDATINTDAQETCPVVSGDGTRLYFASDRVGAETCGGSDLYVSERVVGPGQNVWDSPWGPATLLGQGCGNDKINSVANDFRVAPQEVPGNPGLYFASDRSYQGNEPVGSVIARTPFIDIYYSALANGTYAVPTPDLDLSQTNPPVSDLRPNVSKDGKELFFDTGRPVATGDINLWVSTRNEVTQRWGLPEALPFNVPDREEGGASLSSDGKTLYFSKGKTPTTDSQGNPLPGVQFDIYRTVRETIFEGWLKILWP